MPLVSVVLPAYNAGRYIVDSIRSILDQTLRDLELIVVIDPSTDDTEAKVRSVIDGRLRVVVGSARRGLPASLNEGIRLATGRYIARMDADDLSDPRRLGLQRAFLERHPDFVGCGTWMRLYGKRELIRHEHEPNRLRARLLLNTQFAHPTVMVRAESLRSPALQYDESAKFGEDYDLWIRLSTKGKLTNLRLPLALYRQHPQSLSVQNADIEEEKLAALRRKALRLVQLEPGEREMVVHRCLAEGAAVEPDVTVGELSDWCRRLEAANRSVGYTTEGALRSVLRERLWKIAGNQGPIPRLRHQALRLQQVYLTPR